jgi:hypothetical protein
MNGFIQSMTISDSVRVITILQLLFLSYMVSRLLLLLSKLAAGAT